TALTGGAEPSGAFWNPADQKLYFVSDSGTITRQNQDGTNVVELGTGLGNLEGITATSAVNPTHINYMYVIDENLVRMREYNPNVTATTGAFTGNYWNLSGGTGIPAADVNVAANASIEGITFVPDVTPAGPYGNSQFTTGGLFYVSSQQTGKIYVLDIDIRNSNTAPVLKGTIIPNLITTGAGSTDISDLYYAAATNKLFVLYDANGVVHEMRTNGAYYNEYRTPLSYGGEGITTIPSCSATSTSIILAYDQGSVSKYSNYPQPCVDVTPPVISSLVSTPVGTSVTVGWTTNETSDSYIEYGIGGYTLNSGNVTLKTTGHLIAVTGLPVGTYQYRVKSKDEAGNISSYTTGSFQIGSAAVDPIIYAAGDIAVGDPTGRMQTSNWMLGNLTNVAAILNLGDNAYDNGTLTEFNNYYAPSWGRAALLNLTKPTPGNHEYQTTNASGYYDYFNGVGVNTGRAGTRGVGYYSYNIGNWHLIALNTSSNCSYVSCAVGSTQETWLRNDLTANAGMCTIAYAHHPRYSYNDHGNNTAIQPLWDALADNNVEMYLAGHDHGYEVKKKMNSAGTVVTNGIGVRQFVVGTGGTNNFYQVGSGPNQETAAGSAINNTYGVLKLTLKASSYDWAFVRTSDGAILNSGSESCY
ncbi:MAG: metallophosphoesterase, partial [Candidatus Pacebacteria bacterium]|nr:metallophosphoesterase [Candidatus Paceibacterota bacterium]